MNNIIDYLTFPRWDVAHRAFKTQEEAEKLKMKLKDNFISMSNQPGQIYRVTFWEHYDDKKSMLKSIEEYNKTMPKYEIKKNVLDDMTDEEVNERLQKKITREIKDKPKKKKK